MMRKVFILLGALALAGCQDDGFDRQKGDPPVSQLRQDRTACEAEGGTFRRGGIFATYMCFTTLPDAGQSCQQGADCAGECLVTDTGRQCQSVTPMFGCYGYVEDDGEEVEICVD
mgnify:CR=1 FL=1